jgi:hypothetical protein
MMDAQDMPEGSEDEAMEGEEFEEFDVASELSNGIRTMVALQQWPHWSINFPALSGSSRTKAAE